MYNAEQLHKKNSSNLKKEKKILFYNKIIDRFLMVFFIFAIFLIMIINILAKDKSFSEIENRTLTTMNKFTISSFMNGDFSEYFSSYINDNFDGIRILTVGRLTKEKGCDILPEIVSNIINKGFNIRWYVIGDGEEKERLSKSISENNLEDRLFLLGTKNNPYPFFKDCDIYVQPSRHEGYCITLGEAKRFNKPIITTNFVGAFEQIDNNETGLIVNFNKQEIINSIIEIIKDKELRLYMINNLKKFKYECSYEMEKIYNLL